MDTELIITLTIVVLVFVTITALLPTLYKTKKSELESIEYIPKYSYARKQFIMTKAESDLYKVLQQAIGSSYMIYPQAHLSLFLSHKPVKQDYRAALSVIQRKSVDFLICNKEYYEPMVAIELDDSSHNTPSRRRRDEVVDGICKSAGMPLVRVRWQPSYSANELLETIAPYLK